MPYGEPCEGSESEFGANARGALSYLGGVLRVLINDRADLNVSSTGEEVCLREGLEVGIGASKTRVKTVRGGINSVRTHVIAWL